MCGGGRRRTGRAFLPSCCFIFIIFSICTKCIQEVLVKNFKEREKDGNCLLTIATDVEKKGDKICVNTF